MLIIKHTSAEFYAFLRTMPSLDEIESKRKECVYCTNDMDAIDSIMYACDIEDDE